jgi:hypothetical protein
MWRKGIERTQSRMNSGAYSRQSRRGYYRYMATHQILNSLEYLGLWARIVMALTTGLGNKKLTKALDIKEDLDFDCLLYCKHRLNFHHKDNKNNLKQMFQRELACTVPFHHTMYTRTSMKDECKRWALALSVLENARDT